MGSGGGGSEGCQRGSADRGGGGWYDEKEMARRKIKESGRERGRGFRKG